MTLETCCSRLRSLAVAGAFLACLTGGALAQPDDASDRLGVPGPVSFAGTDYALAWSAKPFTGYFKQEYLPQGESLQSYMQMFIIEAMTSVSLEDAVAAQIGKLKQRKDNDPIVNYEVVRNDRTGEIILDFVMSGNSDGKLVVEWNAYRYIRMEGDGVGLFAISRRGYGDEARDFLSGLANSRADTINALAQFKTPTLSPEE